MLQQVLTPSPNIPYPWWHLSLSEPVETAYGLMNYISEQGEITAAQCRRQLKLTFPEPV